jgi:vacuolar-type H+-ATPase subunit E/Vma4
MGLVEVEQAILRDARLAAERELEYAREDAARIVAHAQAQAARERARFDAETQRLLGVMERREIARAATHRKAILLMVRSEVISETFASARERVTNGSNEEREAFLKAVLVRARSELSSVAIVRCHPHDEAIVQRLAPNARVVGDERIAGGVLAEDASGAIRSELTVDTLLTHIAEHELPAVAQLLFTTSATPKRRRT